MIDATPVKKKIILGTALWGWGIIRAEAFKLLESHFLNGGMIVDTALNYPINKCKEDFGLALRWLTDWAHLNPNQTFSLIVKIGSKDNMGGPDVDLSPDTIIETTDKLREAFGRSLSCVSIHWDDRTDETEAPHAISRTVDALSRVRETGLEIGLSGIKDPQRYYLSNPELANEWVIQVKENFLTNRPRLLYKDYFPNARYFAYGINMGGVKLDNRSNNSSVHLRNIKVESSTLDKMRKLLESEHGNEPRPTDLNQLSLAFAHSNDALSGVIIGPRNVQQLEDTLRYWSALENSDNSSGWTELFNSRQE